MENPSPRKPNNPFRIISVVAVFALLGSGAWFGWPYILSSSNNYISPIIQTPSPVPSQTVKVLSPKLTQTTKPTLQTTAPIDIAPNDGLRKQGIIILSMMDGNVAHLFAYHPQFFPFTRITNSPWDDITPAISPDGGRLAYASRQNGFWNIYIKDLSTGKTNQVTDTPEYDGAPSWSPDNQWLVFESYKEDNLDLYIQSMLNPEQPVIRLTEDSLADFSPAWSPGGRDIAFVSGRSGNEEIWLARLDQVDNRFTNISRSPTSKDNHPAWSPDGRYLAWSSDENSFHSIKIWDSLTPERPARLVGSGDWPVWSPDSNSVLTQMQIPNQTSLGAIMVSNGSLLFPLAQMPGSLFGLDWKAGETPQLLTNLKLPTNSDAPIPGLFQPALSTNPLPPGGRFGMVRLDDVTAPYPYLHDAVDESFKALRQEVAKEAGWDVLSSLESAYVALTEPPTPSMEDNWLLTGRAINLNFLPLNAGWMTVIPEDFDGQTFWRLFIKTRFQDGSQGLPLTSRSWDLNARFAGNPESYEKGGELGSIPSGYWIDFTDIASRYHWERMPSLVNWRTFYPSIRYNQFVLRDGLDWNTAMSEVYPPEALEVNTKAPTQTPTVTETPEGYHLETPTPTFTITPTATIQFTWTPLPVDGNP